MRFLVEIEKAEPGYVTVSVLYRGTCFAEKCQVRDRERVAADMIAGLYKEISADYESKRKADGHESKG